MTSNFKRDWRDSDKPPWWSGKTGMGLFLVAIGALLLFFRPELKEEALGLIMAGAGSTMVGLGHKAGKELR